MKQLLLVGAGLAHLHIIKQLRQTNLPDTEVTLISPSPIHYHAGLFSGFAEGIDALDDISLAIEPLTEAAQATFLQDAVLSIDPNTKQVLTQTGRVLSFDLISFNNGTLTGETNITGARESALTIKPDYRFPEVIDKVRTQGELSIVGDDKMTIELAGAIKAWRHRHHVTEPVRILANGRLLANHHPNISSKIEKHLGKMGIECWLDTPIQEVYLNGVQAKTGQTIPHDHLLWLMNDKAMDMFRKAKLPTDQNDYLLIENTLQVKKYPYIFAVGRTATINQHPNHSLSAMDPLQMGELLWQNIKGYLTNGEGYVFEPSMEIQTTISLGQKKACLINKNKVSISRRLWAVHHRHQRHILSQIKRGDV
ncbi:NAD(P)/FAD-dependent oxidoreductase [Tuberibacillus sp. Marseille-P3662]|uniref:NAD(P)/FAD-dependent oxidoreductase n=1 Tax=Tuberibacillus sp. Marseille-P3662 TaxID=1965358 RepID=UPI000A1CA0A5|nr:FAD-dependent oxidoreductase [Tuberibacillus sp. Marseille-P3662]